MNPMQTTSYIGLAIYIWDWVSKLDQEYKFLWSHSLFNLNAAQILYIFTRYSPLFIHGANIAVLLLREKHLPVIPVHICRRWLLFIVATSSWVMGLLLFNLMLRVYALYNRDPRVILTLIILMSMKLLKVLLYWFIFLPTSQLTTTCVPLNQRVDEIAIFVVIELFVQGIPVYLTFFQSAKIEHATAAQRISVLIAYLRRGGVLCLLNTALFSAFSVVVAIYVQDTPSALPHMSFPLFITFVSILGCHLILQIRQPVNNQTVGTSIELDAWATQSHETDGEDLTPGQTMQRISPGGPAKIISRTTSRVLR